MKISVSPDMRLAEIPASATELHIVRPLKKDMLLGILGKCRGLKTISASASTIARMPAKSKEILGRHNVALHRENSRGRAIEIGLEKMLNVIEMRRDFRSLREIERTTGIPKSTVHYLQKYAQRTKVKKGGRIVYLEGKNGQRI